ncbi:MAG: hypothetical protein AAF170_04355 [Bacteroidota bacterium]
MPDLLDQPTNAPTRKVTASAVAALAGSFLVDVLEQVWPARDLPDTTEPFLVSLLVFSAGYLVRNRRPPASTESRQHRSWPHGIGALSVLLLASAVAAQPRPITQPLSIAGAEHPADATVTVHPNDGSDELVISGMRLHGVAWFDRLDRGPRLTFGPDAQALPVRQLEIAFGRRATWSATVTPTGRDLADLCSPPADPDLDVAPHINWCLRLTNRFAPPADTFGIVGPILVPDGGEIAGAGGAVLGPTHVDRYGVAFRPVVPAASMGLPSTTLRVIDGQAFAFALPDSALTDIQRVRRVLDQERTTVFHASRAVTATVRNLVLDGNATADELASVNRAQAESCLRNAPCHTALAFGRHGGLIVPGSDSAPGRFITLSGLYLHDWAATSVLGDHHAQFTADTILLRNALYNHLLYAAEGTWEHLTLSGYAWTHAILAGQGRGGEANAPSVYRNIVIHELAQNPSGRTGRDIIDSRQGQGSVTIERLYADLRRADGGSGSSAFLAHVRPVDRPEYNPTVPYVPPWNDPNYSGWSEIGDHVFTLSDATVYTESNRLLTLREAGPVTLSDIRLLAPDSTAFAVASPASRTGQLEVSGLSFVDPADSLVTPPPNIPGDVPSPEDPTDARIRQLEAQIEDLTNQLATERATLVQVRDELALTLILLTDERALSLSRQIALDTALLQIATIEARVTELVEDLDDAQADLDAIAAIAGSRAR